MCAERPRSTAVLLVRGLLVWGPLVLGVSGLCALSAAAVHAAEQVFEPGTKHVCVPAASGEGWDCNSGENPPSAPKAPREPRLRSSSEVPAEIIAEPVSTSPAAAEPASAAARGEPVVAPASDSSPGRPTQTGTASRSSRNVPNYLLAPEARETAPDTLAQPASATIESSRNAAAADAAPAAKPGPTARETAQSRLAEAADRDTMSTEASPAPAAVAEDSPRATALAPASPAVVAAPPTVSAPSSADSTARTARSASATMTTATATPATAPMPATTSAPAAPALTAATATASDSAAAESRPVPTSRTLLGTAEFRRLADSRYVIELGSGRSRDAAERSAIANAPVDGTIHVLALQRDGESWYLAVWGDFDSVDAARRARTELLASGATGVGWPRRAGPLKQELGR